MVQRFGRPVVIDGTDWAASKVRRLLDREELENAEALRLRQAGWTPSAGQPAATADPYGRFGDGRDAIADLVQAGLDRRQSLRDEVRRRVDQQFAEARSPTPPIPARKPEDLGGAPEAPPRPRPMPTRPGQSPVEGLPYSPMGPGRNVGEADRQAFRDALESRGGLSPTMRSIFDYVFDFEGGHRPDKSDRRNAPDRHPVTGILQNTLREYQDAFYKANPEVRSAMGSKFFKPGELNDQQRIALMKWYADTRMGDLDINEIARPSTPGTTGDPKLGGLLYDTYYRWGRGRATGAVRGAIAASLKRYRSDLVAAGTNPDDLGVPKQFDLHGGPDSEVHDAIMLLLKAGRSDALRSAIITRVSKLPGASGDNEAYRRSVFK